jgi:hypothetical protein
MWGRSTSAGVRPGAGCGMDAEGDRRTGATSRRRASHPYSYFAGALFELVFL